MEKKGQIQIIPSCLLLVFLGCMDCLTTVIGTVFFGTQELNPVLAGLVNTNILAFIGLKLAVTVAVGLIFVLAQRTLMRTTDQNSASFKFAVRTLKVAYFGILLFLAIVVVNNILVLLHFIV